MAGMKVTLSAAMRARDVSRPRPDQVAAAETRENQATAAGRGSGAQRIARQVAASRSEGRVDGDPGQSPGKGQVEDRQRRRRRRKTS